MILRSHAASKCLMQGTIPMPIRVIFSMLNHKFQPAGGSGAWRGYDTSSLEASPRPSLSSHNTQATQTMPQTKRHVLLLATRTCNRKNSRYEQHYKDFLRQSDWVAVVAGCVHWLSTGQSAANQQTRRIVPSSKLS